MTQNWTSWLLLTYSNVDPPLFSLLKFCFEFEELRVDQCQSVYCTYVYTLCFDFCTLAVLRVELNAHTVTRCRSCGSREKSSITLTTNVHPLGRSLPLTTTVHPLGIPLPLTTNVHPLGIPLPLTTTVHPLGILYTVSLHSP